MNGAGAWSRDAVVLAFSTKRDEEVTMLLGVPVHRLWGGLVLPPAFVKTDR